MEIEDEPGRKTMETLETMWLLKDTRAAPGLRKVQPGKLL